MGSLHKHTLLIPTYNRPEMLGPLLTHLAAFDLQIIILDSSNISKKEANQRLASNFPSLNYQDFPHDIWPWDKCLEGLRLVKTPFVSFLADDDLVFPRGLAACVNALEQSPDALAVQGIYLKFLFQYVPPHLINVGLEYHGASIQDPQPKSRLLQLMSNYESPFYAVYRTDLLLKVIQQYSSCNNQIFKPPLFSELFQAAASGLAGNILRIPDIYYARRLGMTTHENDNNCAPIDWLSEDPKGLFVAYLAYRQNVLDWWEDLDPELSKEEKEKWCDLTHYIYLQRDVGPQQLYRRNPQLSGFIRNEGSIPPSEKINPKTPLATTPLTPAEKIRKYIVEERPWRRPVYNLAKLVRKIATKVITREDNRQRTVLDKLTRQDNSYIKTGPIFPVQLDPALEPYRQAPGLMEGIEALQELVKLNVHPDFANKNNQSGFQDLTQKLAG